MLFLQHFLLLSPHYIGSFILLKYIYTINKPNLLNMLYDTYGEEYLSFLQDLNEILSLNELVELDFF